VTIRHTEFLKYEKPDPKEQLIVGIMHYTYLFNQNCIYVSFHQEEIHHCTAHKWSTETVIHASRLIKNFDHCYIQTMRFPTFIEARNPFIKIK